MVSERPMTATWSRCLWASGGPAGPRAGAGGLWPPLWAAVSRPDLPLASGRPLCPEDLAETRQRHRCAQAAPSEGHSPLGPTGSEAGPGLRRAPWVER